MSNIISKMQDAFTRQGNDLGSLLRLAPAAMQEMARLKANGNKLGFTKDPDGRWYADHTIYITSSQCDTSSDYSQES